MKKEAPSSVPVVRLDKWLWAARFYKTRPLAREMINSGKVRYNGQRTRPGKTVEPGAEITLRQGEEERTVLVRAVAEQRRPAVEAQQLYLETEASLEKRTKLAAVRQTSSRSIQPPAHRPDKKARRQLINFKHQHGE